MLAIRDKQLFRNGQQVAEPYVQFLDEQTFVEGDEPTSVKRDQLITMEIPDREVFVLGDSRDRSHDSRFFGSLPVSSVVGRVK